MSDPAFQRMSVAEYLRSEPESPVKREYVDGFVYPLHSQAGAGKAHVLIGGNITAALHADARRMGCRLYQSGVWLCLPSNNGSFFYPDAMVVCDLESAEDDFESRPCLLVEVLSPSTAANDRVGKFAAYTAIPSLQTYLMVEQAERRVYAYQRQDQDWVLSEVAGAGVINLPCLSAALPLDEVYGGVLA